MKNLSIKSPFSMIRSDLEPDLVSWKLAQGLNSQLNLKPTKGDLYWMELRISVIVMNCLIVDPSTLWLHCMHMPVLTPSLNHIHGANG